MPEVAEAKPELVPRIRAALEQADNTYSNEGQQVYQAAQAAGCPPFTLVTVGNLDCNHDMAPWDNLECGDRVFESPHSDHWNYGEYSP